MPWLTPHACRGPGCGTMVRGRAGFCSECRPASRRKADERRPTAGRRGYGASWRAQRKAYLDDHPVCERPRCGAEARVVDHRLPLRDGGEDHESNYQSLCKPCHDSWKQRQDYNRRRRHET